MRATISLALLAALPAALAAGTCREGLEYCGSTLLWHGMPTSLVRAKLILEANWNSTRMESHRTT
jgi:hypothetical protein